MIENARSVVRLRNTKEIRRYCSQSTEVFYDEIISHSSSRFDFSLDLICRI